MPLDTIPPIALRHRKDGWTPQRQRDFLLILIQTRSVTRAARAVGLSASSGYRLRRRPDAQAFSAAWNAAFDYSVRRGVGVVIEPEEGVKF
jgi:hypothetical protein